MANALKNLLSIMDDKLSKGLSLKDIYDETIYWMGSLDGPLIFSEFVNKHKKDDGFMIEFNKTIFLDTKNKTEAIREKIIG